MGRFHMEGVIVITIKNVNFSYTETKKQALTNINLEVKPGEVIVLTGKSGCGKTTLTRILNGLIPHYITGNLDGEIQINGQNMKDLDIHEIAALTGSVFQNPKTQFYNLDTNSELVFTVENFGLPAQEIHRRKVDAIKHFELEPLLNRNLFHLSGGEKQRIACASVAIHNPPVIILDEPSANLDIEATEQLADIIRYWQEKGSTIIISEHKLYYLRDIADRFIIMENGQLIETITRDKMNKMTNHDLHSRGLRALHLNKLVNVAATIPRTSSFKVASMTMTHPNHSFTLATKAFELPPASVYAITGHNGAGKSTFAHCLTGLIRRVKPQFELENTTYKKKQCLSASAIVMQDVNHQLFTESVLTEVLLSMTTPDREKALSFLKLLNLAHLQDAHPLSLSGGEKQRLAIVSALASNKKLFILDEPTSGLDYYHLQQFVHCIDILRKQKKQLFIITHDPELIALSCDGTIEIASGRIKEITTFTS